MSDPRTPRVSKARERVAAKRKQLREAEEGVLKAQLNDNPALFIPVANLGRFSSHIDDLYAEGRADEVADLVVYLASEKSSFVTGANFDINGGLAFS